MIISHKLNSKRNQQLSREVTNREARDQVTRPAEALAVGECGLGPPSSRLGNKTLVGGRSLAVAPVEAMVQGGGLAEDLAPVLCRRDLDRDQVAPDIGRVGSQVHGAAVPTPGSRVAAMNALIVTAAAATLAAAIAAAM